MIIEPVCVVVSRYLDDINLSPFPGLSDSVPCAP